MNDSVRAQLDRQDYDLDITAKLPSPESAKRIREVAEDFVYFTHYLDALFVELDSIRKENGVSEDDCHTRTLSDQAYYADVLSEAIQDLSLETGADEEPVRSLFERVIREEAPYLQLL